MKEILATSKLLFGSSIEIEKGNIVYWKDGIYSENWQSWTINIYKKEGEEYVRIGIVPCREFSREVQRMQDKKQ